jgi:hypothetical protein
MSDLTAPADARFHSPRKIGGLPFAETIDIARGTGGSGEPAPCVPSARSVWYALDVDRAGRLLVDLSGSTPRDAVVRLYRRTKPTSTGLEFVGCASLVWNGRLTLEAHVRVGDEILLQIGTSRSRTGRIVLRVERRQ